MLVTELNQRQLDELKITFICETNPCPSWGEIAEAMEISNETIYEHYEGYDFSSDDFFCTMGS